MTDTPRGIRNKNPLNIRRGDQWRGLATPDQVKAMGLEWDPDFCQFTADVYGLRAAVKIFATYRQRGIETVREVISAWAPAVENDVASYVADVAQRVGVGPDEPFDLVEAAYCRPLLKAMIQHENGQQPYSDTLLNDAVSLAMA